MSHLHYGNSTSSGPVVVALGPSTGMYDPALSGNSKWRCQHGAFQPWAPACGLACCYNQWWAQVAALCMHCE